MRKPLGVVSLLLILASVGVAGTAVPITEDFDGDLTGWTVANCRIDNDADALVAGVSAGTSNGAISHIEAAVQDWNRKGDFTAEIDLGTGAWAARSVEIRVSKGSDMVVCARVTAYAKGREAAAEKHVRLSLSTYERSTQTATRTEVDLGDVACIGTLRLEVDNADAKALFNGSPTGVLTVATTEKISSVRLGMLGDRDLAPVMVTSFNAQP